MANRKFYPPFRVSDTNQRLTQLELQLGFSNESTYKFLHPWCSIYNALKSICYTQTSKILKNTYKLVTIMTKKIKNINACPFVSCIIFFSSQRENKSSYLDMKTDYTDDLFQYISICFRYIVSNSDLCPIISAYVWEIS